MSAAALALPTTPQAPELFFSGDPGGATTRYYWVVARFGFGISAISPYTAVVTVATLNSNNKVFINIKPVPGALSYDILRTTTSATPTGTATNALAVGITGNWVDFGQALSSYAVGAQGFTSAFGGSADQTFPQFATVSLTATQIKAMSTAIPILAAPGAGKALILDSILASLTRTATAFANGGVTTFIYHTTTTSVAVTGGLAAAFINGAAGVANQFLGPNVGATGILVPANEGVDIINDTAPFITGTGTMKLFVQYRTVTL